MRSSFQILKDSFSKILDNAAVFLSIIALPAVIAIAISFIEPGVNSTGEFVWKNNAHMVQYIVAMLVFMVVSMLTTIAVTVVADNKLILAVDAYKIALGKLVKSVIMAVLSSIIVLLGFLCLVLPGIWLAISFTFALYFLVLRNTGARESLKRSFALVKGRWWTVFGKSLLFGIFYLLCLVPVYIVLGVVSSFVGETVSYTLESVLSVFGSLLMVVFMYELFTDLERTQSVEAQVAPLVSDTPASGATTV